MSAEDPAKAYAVASALPSPGAADYAAICDAVLATERGRWFLSEYARRNRQADTAELLAAIERIAARSGDNAAARSEMPSDGNIDFEGLRAELAEVADAIARTRTELASATAGPAASEATREAHTERDEAAAPLDILSAAEEIQELAWTMREQGFDSQFSDRLDRCAATCLAASRRDRGMRRVRRIRHMMARLQGRIEAIIAMLGSAASAMPSEQTAVPPDEAPGSDSLPFQQGRPLLLATGGQAADEHRPAAQTSSSIAADGEEREDAPNGPGPILMPPSRENDATGKGRNSPMSTDHAETDHAESVIACSPQPRVVGGAATLTIEGPKGSFSIMPARAAELSGPITPPAQPLEPGSTPADVRAFALDLAAEGPDGSPAGQSPPGQPTAMPAETSEISSAAPTAGDDDIFRESEDLPLAAAPQLADPPQRPVPAPPAPARATTTIAEYLLADVMALSEEERLALFT